MTWGMQCVKCQGDGQSFKWVKQGHGRARKDVQVWETCPECSGVGRVEVPFIEFSQEDMHRVAALLRQYLTISVERGNFTDPNSRTVKVMFDGELVAEDSFDVVQKAEYEG